MFAVDTSFNTEPHFVKYAARNAKDLKGMLLSTFQEARQILPEPASFTDMGLKVGHDPNMAFYDDKPVDFVPSYFQTNPAS